MAKESPARGKNLYARVRTFLREPDGRNDTPASKFHHFFHFWMLVAREFARNRCPVRASALAYTTLLALIPLLAVAISISTSMLKLEKGEKFIQDSIDTVLKKVAPQVGLVSQVDTEDPSEPGHRPLSAYLKAGDLVTAVNGAAIADVRQFTEAVHDAAPGQKMKLDYQRAGTSNQLEVFKEQGGGADALLAGIVVTNLTSELKGRFGIVHGKGVVVTKAVSPDDAVQKVTDFVNQSIKKINSGTLGATAVLALLFVGISLLANIEATMNDIWGVTQGRSWFARVVQYWAVITLGPILLLVAVTLNAGPYFDSTRDFLQSIPGLAIVYSLLPPLVVSGAFAVFYLLMPNTKVEWKAAVVGGLVGGILLHLNSQASVIYFGQVVRNSKIYGSLGIVPVILIGLYLSWLILLFGAQVSYAFQNRRAYRQKRMAEKVNELGREFVAFRVMTRIAADYREGQPAPCARAMADELSVPSQLVTTILGDLLEHRLVMEVAGPEAGFAPGRPLERITLHDILCAVRVGHGTELETAEDPFRRLVRDKFREIVEAEREVAEGTTLAALREKNSLAPGRRERIAGGTV